MNREDVILVDTCVIIEAQRTGTWVALHKGLRLETVETCLIEAQTGRAHRLNPMILDAELRQCFQAVYDISDIERAEHFANVDGDLPDLDPGELDLWIHALQRNDVWFLCGPDRASMNFGSKVGHRDRLVSFEQALNLVGAKTNGLKNHYRAGWLADVKTQLALGQL